MINAKDARTLGKILKKLCEEVEDSVIKSIIEEKDFVLFTDITSLYKEYSDLITTYSVSIGVFLINYFFKLGYSCSLNGLKLRISW